jgi:hypothetical protein
MINSVLTTPVPGWIMSLLASQDGLTACYYHCRNVEHIEHAVDDVARRIYADPPADMSETNMSFAARKLTYEYQAFIFALRRSFDYLAGALSLGFACPQATSFKDVPKKLKHATMQDRAAANAICAKVEPTRKAFRRSSVIRRVSAYATRSRTAGVCPEASSRCGSGRAGRSPSS